MTDLATMERYNNLKTCIEKLPPDDSCISNILQKKKRFGLKGRRNIESIVSIQQLFKEIEKQLLVSITFCDILQESYQKESAMNKRMPGPSPSRMSLPLQEIATPCQAPRRHLHSTSEAISIPVTPRRRRISTPTTPTTPTSAGWTSGTSPLPSPSRPNLRRQRDVPDHVINLIATDFDKIGGPDWRIFVEGLGCHLSEFERVKLPRGEVERCERDNPDLRNRLRTLFSSFQNRCQRTAIDIDMKEAIIRALKSKNVWGDAVYNLLARHVDESFL
eukprot:TRINITY_DN3424_c0_g1_i13.p1 TRINITY_DN3424_c0_g1~~TRINITY_DN3424_c0_g1_i13.p1  ORF type:complete len:275 (+),score=22.17 TRINITY_DN3424_c0_g1_i13:39-863(+)